MEINERVQKHIERMDLTVRALEIKWEIMFSVLHLVPPDLATKFRSQWQKLNDALRENNHEDIILLSDGVIRGCWALDRAAIIAGHEPMNLPKIGDGIKVNYETRIAAAEYVPTGKSMDESLEGF